MRRADFAIIVMLLCMCVATATAAGDGGVMGGCGGVVQGHVGFYFFGIGAGGGFPAGFFGGGVEVVREVFGVGVADFPGWGEAGVLGGRLEGEGED